MNCGTSDERSIAKTLRNESHNGFVSREFFQVIVESKYPTNSLSILEKRKQCREDSEKKRDIKTLIMLKNALEQEKLQAIQKIAVVPSRLSSLDVTYSPKVSLLESDSEFTPEMEKKFKSEVALLLGPFQWFLDGLFLYKEDYSEKDKCNFIYRNISKNLYEKTVTTKIPDFDVER
jgi:hypothetical protein